MLDDQALSCREEYLEGEQYRQEAWDAACKTLQTLFAQWANESLIITFVPVSFP